MNCHGSAHRQAGFTFLEVLIALVVLTILATVILESSIRVLRSQEKSRRIQEARFAASRVAAEAWMGRSASDMAADMEGWIISSEPVTVQDGTNSRVWNRWVICPTNQPTQETVLFLAAPPKPATGRAPSGSSGSRPSAGGSILNPILGDRAGK